MKCELRDVACSFRGVASPAAEIGCAFIVANRASSSVDCAPDGAAWALREAEWEFREVDSSFYKMKYPGREVD